MKYAQLCLLLAVALLGSGNAYAASEIEEIKIQVQQLLKRIEQLESAERVREVSHQMADEEDGEHHHQELTHSDGDAGEHQGQAHDEHELEHVARDMGTGNPSISVIGSFTGSRIRGSDGARSSSFLPLSEAEFIFGARIDPHVRLDVTLTAANGSMALEEGFITANLPWDIHLRAGRKFLPIGMVNEKHPHALVYADRPNGLVNLFGPEIFIGDGVLLDSSFRLADSKQTLTAGFFSTQNDVAFDPTGTSQYAAMARWDGLWSLGDSASFELGGNYVQGKNGIAAGDAMTRIGGGYFALTAQDMLPIGFTLQGEWLRRWREQGAGVTTAVNDGAYLLATASVSRNWQLFSRFDYSREYNPASPGWLKESALSAGLVWEISEFQNLTLQYKHTRNALAEVAGDLGITNGADANAWYLRWIVAIGAHGEHDH